LGKPLSWLERTLDKREADSSKLPEPKKRSVKKEIIESSSPSTPKKSALAF
jgi:hypothetical protein